MAIRAQYPLTEPEHFTYTAIFLDLEAYISLQKFTLQFPSVFKNYEIGNVM